jgi:hypothetical protein
MTRRLRVVFGDDLDDAEQGEFTEAHETITFAWEGEPREIDLTTEHAAEFRQVMKRYLAASHPIGEQPPSPAGTPAPAVSGWMVNRSMREWADKYMPDGYTRRGNGRTGYDYTRELRLAFLGHLTEMGSPWQHHQIFADLKAGLP